MSKWREVPADEIAENIAIGPFGSRMKADCYVDRGVPIIRGNNITDTKALAGEFVFITEEMAKGMSACNAYDGDLVFPHRGLIGEVGIVTGGKDAHFFISSSLMKLRPKREIADPLFYFYFYRSPAGRHELLKNASQVGTPGIATPLTSLRATRVPLPPLPEQRAIASVLGSLDDKIELNRRMNETLEALAQSLFKSWFVDATQSALPKGWRESTIRELASNIQYGLTQSASTEPVGPRFLRITDIQGGRVDWGNVPYCKVSPEEHEHYRVKPGDVLVARTGASTGENIYLPVAPDAVFASYLVRFQFAEPSMARLIGAFMRTPAYFEYVAGCIGGSAQPNASAQVLAGATLAVPPPGLAKRFADAIAPFDNRIAGNNEESRTLAALRDALLPKLLSGELPVNA